MNRKKQEIDFVITWVDGDDPEWQQQRREYSPVGMEDARTERYREWGLLLYWFRGVEKYAPWVRTVHLVTSGHLPKWLNREAPKLHIVNHEDFMPVEALPIFNCNPLEINLHRIPFLSEHFVYFNDDVLLLNPVKKTDFFIHGKPRDMLALQPVVANPKNPVMTRILQNDSLIIGKYFNKRDNMRQNLGKYFHIGYPLIYFVYNLLEACFPLYTGFYTVHGPSPLLKSTYREVWEKEEEYLLSLSRKRFRSGDDVNQYLFREWEKQKGNFVPRNLHCDFQYFDLNDSKRRYLEVIRKAKKKVICVNDSGGDIPFEDVKADLLGAFESILPEKSSFEK